MSNDKKDFLKKHLGDDFEDVLGGVLDETFGDDEEVENEPENDDEFDFSQFSSILDEIDEDKKTEKKPIKDELKVEEEKQEEEELFFNLDEVELEPQEVEKEQEEDFLFDFDIQPVAKEQKEEVMETAKEEEINFVDEKVEDEHEEISEKIIEKPVLPEPAKKHSNDIFSSIHEKIHLLEKAQKELEALKEKQEKLKNELKEVVQILLSHVEFKQITQKGLISNGKVEEYFSARGLFVSESKDKSSELWLLIDGTFVEFGVKNTEEHGMKYISREISERIPELDVWGLENILFALNERLNEYLLSIEEKIKRLS